MTMREIPLTQGKVAIVDDEDFERVSAFRWHALKRPNGLWHAVRTQKRQGKKQHIYMHRFITGALPGEEVDHENRNGLDNQRKNIRRCTKRQNSLNRRQSSHRKSSRFHGVAWHEWSRRWRVVICAGEKDQRGNSKQLYVGVYRDEEAAARAYDMAAIKHFGEFATTNFPREDYENAAHV